MRTGSNYTSFICSGSGTSPYGNFSDVSGVNSYYLDPAGTRTLVPYSSYPTALKYNYAPTAALQGSDKRWEAGALGHYEVNDYVDLYSEVMFMDNQVYAQQSPSGLFAGSGPTGTVTFTCNDNPAVAPYMSPQQEAAICDDPNHTKLGSTVNISTPGLRFANTPRANEFEHQDYRVCMGARGDINSAWSYDVSAQFWQANLTNIYSGDVLFGNAQQAIDNGTLDLFQLGSVTSAAAAAAGGPGLQTGHTREYDIQANISGDLGAYGIASPFAKDPVAVAGGIEWRRDELNILPDANFQQGNFLGGNQLLPVAGGENVREEFLEVRVPVIQDMPFIKAFDINPASVIRITPSTTRTIRASRSTPIRSTPITRRSTMSASVAVTTARRVLRTSTSCRSRPPRACSASARSRPIRAPVPARPPASPLAWPPAFRPPSMAPVRSRIARLSSAVTPLAVMPA